MPETNLPARLDRAWALGEGRKLESRAAMEDLVVEGSKVLEVDILAVGSLHHCRRAAIEHGRKLVLRAPSAILIERLAASDPGPEAVEAPPIASPFLERMGRVLWDAGQEATRSWRFAMDMFSGIFALLTRRERSWPNATWRQLHELGTTALPVVLLLTGLIGLTLALLMGQQLAQYGASVHLATLMGVSFVREVGPLLTAVILAGRSGSAIAAELASMKVQEEVDALRTMGARDATFLIAPRVVALVIATPFLSLFASACGIAAGLVVAVFRLDLAPTTYFQVLIDALRVKDVFYTFLKSGVFAMIIAFLACRIGLSTRGGSDAVGRATTRTVVAGIFWTVIADCIFALALYL